MPMDNSQQTVQQTQQSYQQNVESKQTSYSYQQQQQSTTTNSQQSVQVPPAQNNVSKPVSILKQSLPTMPVAQPSENNLKPQQPTPPEAYSPGPGQQMTAPRRGKGELKQQQPGMRTPICGACDGQIRC